MATAKKAAPSKSTAIANWDEELAAAAAASAAMEASAAGGQFFSMRGGQLTWNDAPVPNNTLGAIIVDSILENVYYPDAFDIDNPRPPACFAFGRDDKTLTPHESVVELGQHQWALHPVEKGEQSENCAGCHWNEFGTADKGRGKACRNTRRLALLAAGQFDAQGRFSLFEDEETFSTASFGFMKLPVTSVKGYASYVKTIGETLKRPPWAMVTKIRVVPDAKNQFKALFEPLMNVPNSLLATLKKRNADAAAIIEFPYVLDFEDDAPAPTKGRRAVAPGKPVGRGAAPPARKAMTKRY